jgi:short-subunit dehydrogenase
VSTRRRILITGASAGLGEQMARDFAAMGRDLALCARRADRLKDLRSELLAAHPGIAVAVYELDVTDHARVFEVFDACRADLGGLDRVIVNAALGEGRQIGTGGFAVNAAAANTNFVAVLAQCEAAMEIFRKQGAGHLVVVSSIAGLRGLPRHLTGYSAAKAGVATLAEGIRADVYGSPIKVTTIYPGYIISEMNPESGRPPLTVSTEKGVRTMVRAIEAERAEARVPWRWVPIGFGLRHLPVRFAARVR